MAKHDRPRDIPHVREKTVKHFTETTRARVRAAGVAPRRVRKADGTSFPAQSLTAGVRPMRPPICMLFEDLARDEDTGVFGMYPKAFIGKVLPWLRAERREVLHVCSGGLPRGEGIRVDLRPEARPDIIADGRRLPFADGSVAAALIDPPYTEHYARELYGVEYPLPSHLLAEAARVVRPGGRIGLVHYLVMNPPPGCHHVKTFGLSMGFGYPMRAVTFYEREQASLAFYDSPSPAPEPVPASGPRLAPDGVSAGTGSALGTHVGEGAGGDLSEDSQSTSGEAERHATDGTPSAMAPHGGGAPDAGDPCEGQVGNAPQPGGPPAPAESASPGPVAGFEGLAAAGGGARARAYIEDQRTRTGDAPGSQPASPTADGSPRREGQSGQRSGAVTPAAAKASPRLKILLVGADGVETEATQ